MYNTNKLILSLEEFYKMLIDFFNTKYTCIEEKEKFNSLQTLPSSS